MTMLEPIAPEESRLVFGNSYMYSVMVEIAGLRGGKFSSKTITDATRLSPGIVHPLIQKLPPRELHRVRGARAWRADHSVSGPRESLVECGEPVRRRGSRYRALRIVG
ncbi:hypothetical protein [Microbacterium aurum]